jgi:ferredoxin
METAGSGTLKPDLQGVPQIDFARCSGCGRCVAACPVRIITLDVAGFRKHAAIMHPERCNLCGRCMAECPVETVSF